MDGKNDVLSNNTLWFIKIKMDELKCQNEQLYKIIKESDVKILALLRKCVIEELEERKNNKSEAWKRDDSNNNDKTYILKELQSYLNKITIQTYDRISNKILNLNINDQDTLTKSCSIIFEKAVTEPTFCTMYANLIKRLGDKEIIDPSTSKQFSFKGTFLKICQSEFEKHQNNNTVDDLDEEALWKYNQRVKGTVHLLKSLYQVKMIPVFIVRNFCLDRLLKDAEKDPSCHAPESLCKLIKDLNENLKDCKIVDDTADDYIERLLALKKNVRQHHGMRLVFLVEDAIDIIKPLSTKYKESNNKNKHKKNDDSRNLTDKYKRNNRYGSNNRKRRNNKRNWR